jgi:hypothetical protein
MAVLFDKLKLAGRLEAAGMPPQQARDVAAALADTLTGTVATKADIQESELRLRAEITATKAEIMRWMIAQTVGIIGAVAALVRLIH